MSKNDDDWILGALLLVLFWFFKRVIGGIPPIIIPGKDKKDEEPTNGNGKPRPEEEPSPEPVTPTEEPTKNPIETLPPFIDVPLITPDIFAEPAPAPIQTPAPYQSPYETPTYKAPGITTGPFGLMQIETTPEMVATANLLTGAAILPIEPLTTSLSELFTNLLKSPKSISPFVTPVGATGGTPIAETPLVVGQPTTPAQAEFEEFFKEATLPLIRW